MRRDFRLFKWKHTLEFEIPDISLWGEKVALRLHIDSLPITTCTSTPKLGGKANQFVVICDLTNIPIGIYPYALLLVPGGAVAPVLIQYGELSIYGK